MQSGKISYVILTGIILLVFPLISCVANLGENQISDRLRVQIDWSGQVLFITSINGTHTCVNVLADTEKKLQIKDLIEKGQTEFYVTLIEDDQLEIIPGTVTGYGNSVDISSSPYFFDETGIQITLPCPDASVFQIQRYWNISAK